MTDWTTARVTPEIQAELRRLLDATETPWALWDGYGPDGNGDMRVARIGHLSGSGIRADPDSADIYGRREAFELLASAVNALPALLDAAAERDALAAAVRELTEAIRFTVEYVGLEMLPPIDGWSWFDALVKYDPLSAAQFGRERGSSASDESEANK